MLEIKNQSCLLSYVLCIINLRIIFINNLSLALKRLKEIKRKDLT